MKFVKADLKESQEDFHDIYVKQLQNSIRHIKESREMEERFMILEEMLRDERAAGRREGLQEGELNGQRAMLRSFLEDLGSIPPELEKKLFEESDATVLKNWLKIAATSKSIEEFIQIIYVFLTIFLYLLKCPQSLILSALRAFCFCGKPHISRSIFLYFRYQAWLKSW